MVNYKKIVGDLSTLIKRHKQVRSFGIGDIKQLSYFIEHFKDEDGNVVDNQPDNNSTRYPLVYVIPQPVQRDRRTKTYSFFVIVADILSPNYSNETDVWSDTLQIAEDILAQFGYSITQEQGEYYEDYDIITPTSITPFSESYDDYLSGWNLNLTVVVSEPLDRCDAAFESFITTTTTTSSNLILQENGDNILTENNNNLEQE